MHASIPEESRKALEEKVDVSGRTLNEALAVLADSLGNFGFAGSLRLQLTVTIKDQMFGDEKVTLERTTSLKFKY